MYTYRLSTWQSGKKFACQCRRVGDKVSIPGSERFSEVGNGNPLHYSWLGNPMDRGTCLARVHGVTKESDMT